MPKHHNRSKESDRLEGAVNTTGSVNLMGFLVAMAIVAAVSLGVIAFAPGNKPKSMTQLVPYLWTAMGLFAIAGAFVYIRARKRLLVERKEQLLIHVGNTTYTGPFTWEHGYFTVRMRGIPMRHLVLQIYDEKGNHLLGLTEVWGAVHGEPNGWPQVDYLHPRGTPGPVLSISSGRRLRKLLALLANQPKETEGSTLTP